MELQDYNIKILNKNEDVIFSRDGRFYNDKDALEHTYSKIRGFDLQSHIVNITFILSGGLSKNTSTLIDETVVIKIVLFNKNKNVKVVYDYEKSKV